MIVKWGVIGCGDIAQRMGIPAILQAARSELVAVADTNAARAAEVGARFGARRSYSSVEGLLRDKEVNAVYIAVPPAAHHDLTVQCASAGKHVLCEKPMAATAAECADMIQTCAARRVQLAVAYYRRFYPKVEKIQGLLQAGRIGQVVFARIQFTMWYNPSNPADAKEWRTQRAAGGGGCLVDLGSHRLDILTALLGDANRVSASLGTTACDYAVEDCAYVLAEFSDGARAFANFHWNTQARTDELEIYGTEGRIVATPLDGAGLHLHTTAGEESWELPRNELTHLPVVENMVRSLNGEEPLRVPGEEAIKASRIIDAAYRSARDGSAVTQ
jgi:predicted dehydrogenase